MRSPSASISMRMPATLRPATRTSLGHLMAAPGAHSATAAATATPATSPICGAAATSIGGRSTTDMYRLRCGGDTQVRPSRPRPCVCASAMTTVPSAAPAAAYSRATVFVESVLSR